VDGGLTGANGSISEQTYTTGASSKLFSYWPSIAFQDTSGTLQEIQYNTTRSITGWSQESLNIRGINGTSISEVPVRSDFVNGEIGIFYQRDDQKLYEYRRNLNGEYSARQLF